MNSVFDSTKLLKEWQEHGAWPKIHDEIIGLIHHTADPDAVVMDLCCSTGILPQRINDQCERAAVGVEWLAESIDTGREHGVTVPILNQRITVDTVDEVVGWAEEHGVTAVSARRCLSELAVAPTHPNGPPSSQELDFGLSRALWNGLVSAGVTDLWLQGRAKRADAVHPVPDTAAEVAWVEASGVMQLHKKTKNCAWMRPVI